jgi:hypothetical protein
MEQAVSQIFCYCCLKGNEQVFTLAMGYFCLCLEINIIVLRKDQKQKVFFFFSTWDEDEHHRAGRVLSFFGSRLGLSHPLTRRRVCPPPPLVPGGGAHSLAREGVGESQFRRGDIHCGTL